MLKYIRNFMIKSSMNRSQLIWKTVSMEGRRPRWPQGASAAFCATLAFCVTVVGSASAQLLMSDNFDEVGNTNGAAPSGGR